MIFFKALKYLQYVMFSRHRKGHGIHSPFVFDLVSRVFRNKIDPDIVCTIEKIRKKMISDQRSIIVEDMGAGSERIKTNKRKVSEIARYSPVPYKYGVLLSNIAKEFGQHIIIEFGTSFGISTMYLAAGCPDAIVYTMEGSHAVSEIASENFEAAGINNIRLLTGSFDEILPTFINKTLKPVLVFIDGNHRREPVIRYFNQIADISDNKSVIIIDDIYYSKEMEEAWNEIKQHKKVSLTIDIFKMGFVFFRKGVSHFNYIIRY